MYHRPSPQQPPPQGRTATAEPSRLPMQQTKPALVRLDPPMQPHYCLLLPWMARAGKEGRAGLDGPKPAAAVRAVKTTTSPPSIHIPAKDKRKVTLSSVPRHMRPNSQPKKSAKPFAADQAGIRKSSSSAFGPLVSFLNSTLNAGFFLSHSNPLSTQLTQTLFLLSK